MGHSARTLALASALLVAGCATLSQADRADLARDRDRAAVEATLERYMVGIDSMDEAIYRSAFAPDATFELNGQVYQGRDAIGGIIAGVRSNYEARLAQSKADGSPPPNTLFHIRMNARISFVDEDTAIHRSYYETISQAPDGAVRIGAIGRYDDTLKRIGGEWLIVSRTLIPSSPAEAELP